jgi:magnesium chelatase subunit H
MFTQVRSANRRVSPAATGQPDGRAVLRAVYVVLEPQYQNALTTAATSINEHNTALAVDLSGYLIEELRDPQNYADFCADVAEADVFIASLIFIEDLAQKVVEAVAPHRDRLKAAVVFPSMPR